MNTAKRVRVDVDRDDDDTRKLDKGYKWETNYVRSWDQIVEDPTTGRLQSYERQEQIARKRRRDDGVRGARRGVIRYTVLIVDTSGAMNDTDMKPSRSEVVCGACGEFIRNYFDQNPISQLAVITTRDSMAVKLSGLSSNPNQHIDAIQEALNLSPYGEASLLNALNLARALLAPIPSYGTREILIAFGSLSTCDPGNIHEAIDKLEPERIRCSAVGLGAEVHILRHIAKKTNGTYSVALDDASLADLLSSHVTPPPTTAGRVPASLIRMGFPALKRLEKPTPCLDNTDIKRTVGYECPRCGAWLSEMPCECILCGLSLVSSPHLARSYHHLFPVPRFLPLDEKSSEAANEATQDEGHDALAPSEELALSKQRHRSALRCFSCMVFLSATSSLRVECPRCRNTFCVDCDIFLHDSLHHCPGCGTTERSILD